MSAEGLWVTGMAVNTPLGDTLEGTLEALLAGRSAISRWRTLDASRIYAKIGGDLGDYDEAPRARMLGRALPPGAAGRLERLLRRAPWSLRLGLLVAAGAAVDAGLSEGELGQTAVVVAGHNLNGRLVEEGCARMARDPASLEASHELYALDTTTAAMVSELLGSRLPAYTIGGACASGNLALLAGARELRLRGAPRVLVVGALPDASVSGLHAFALIGALSIASFNDTPEQASRPWDVRREGFVPAHGCAAMLLERAEVAQARGARPHAALEGAAVCSDANHLTVPDTDGQARAMALALRRAGRRPEEVDFVSAHATSTPQGDRVELEALRRALGPQAERVRINAPKSMLGHTFSAAALVEGVAGVLQMSAARLHGSRNIEALDPAVDLDVCASGNVDADIRCMLNNAFGFGGINTASVFARVDR